MLTFLTIFQKLVIYLLVRRLTIFSDNYFSLFFRYSAVSIGFACDREAESRLNNVQRISAPTPVTAAVCVIKTAATNTAANAPSSVSATTTAASTGT